MENIKRIICVGNRLIPEDSAGPMVYDCLTNKILPDDVEVIDGGLAGLDLLRFIKGAARVVFVDSTDGFNPSGGVVILNAEDAAEHANKTYDHSAGLAYLLNILPRVLDGKMPEICLVGLEGFPDAAKIDKAANISLKIAVKGMVE